MAGSSWSVQGFWGTDGTPRDYGTAKNQWKAQGYDLLPDGTKVKLGAPAAPAQSQSLGGLGGTLATVGLGGSPGTPAAGGPAMGGGNTTLDQLTNIADPWSSQRGQYQTQLSSLMKDPSSFLQSDLFKASTAAGLEGINRSAAAGGMLKSGNRLQALMDYGQKNAPENFFRMADLLGGFGGAKSQNPGGGLRSMADLTNAATNQYQAETGRQGLDINRYQAETGRMGVELGDKRALSEQQSAQTRWQQEQQQQQERFSREIEERRRAQQIQDKLASDRLELEALRSGYNYDGRYQGY